MGGGSTPFSARKMYVLWKGKNTWKFMEKNYICMHEEKEKRNFLFIMSVKAERVGGRGGG